MSTVFGLARRGVIFVFVALATFGTTTSAYASTDAEAFTQHLIDEGVQILRASNDPQRKMKFRDFITQFADVRKTARFTLGNYARTASQGDLDAFVGAFKDYAIAIYESQLEKYKGESLKVVGSIDNKPGDYIVKTIVASSSKDPMRIDFRLAGGNSAYKFYDISVEGAWLAISQQEQFKTFLEQNRGNIPALTADLMIRTQKIQNGGQ